MHLSVVVFVFSVLISVKSEERVATNEPQFVSKGGEKRVKEGQTVELECLVEDLGEFVLLWKFNRTTVLFAGNLRIHRDDRISRNDSTGSLTIKDFRPENSGEYSCQVSTNPPQDIVYQVLLLGPPIIQGEQRQQIIGKKGDRIELKCETNAENIEWRKEKQRISTQTKNSLIIQSIDEKDSAIYSCIASNEMGESRKEFDLRVLYMPHVTAVNKVIHSPIGQQAIVECIIKSEPQANVFWFRTPNLKVLPSNKIMIDRNETISTLKINSITSDDYGEYQCFANNSLGHSVQNIHVTGRPSTPIVISPVLGGKQKSYRLEWSLESESPIIRYTIKWKAREDNNWKEKEIEISSEDSDSIERRDSFEIQDLKEDENYEAIIRAHNTFGMTQSPVFAFVTSFASIIQNNSFLLFISFFFCKYISIF